MIDLSTHIEIDSSSPISVLHHQESSNDVHSKCTSSSDRRKTKTNSQRFDRLVHRGRMSADVRRGSSTSIGFVYKRRAPCPWLMTRRRIISNRNILRSTPNSISIRLRIVIGIISSFSVVILFIDYFRSIFSSTIRRRSVSSDGFFQRVESLLWSRFSIYVVVSSVIGFSKVFRNWRRSGILSAERTPKSSSPLFSVWWPTMSNPFSTTASKVMMVSNRARKCFFLWGKTFNSLKSDASWSFRLAELDRMHDENTEKFIECIKTSHDVCGENNFIAIKVTALIQPRVLKKFNELLQSIDDRSSLPPLFEFINRPKVNKELNAEMDPLVESSFLTNQVSWNRGKKLFVRPLSIRV